MSPGGADIKDITMTCPAKCQGCAHLQLLLSVTIEISCVHNELNVRVGCCEGRNNLRKYSTDLCHMISYCGGKPERDSAIRQIIRAPFPVVRICQLFAVAHYIVWPVDILVKPCGVRQRGP